MGTLAVDAVQVTTLYGELAVRYQTFREFYGCVVKQVNDHKSPSECVK